MIYGKSKPPLGIVFSVHIEESEILCVPISHMLKVFLSLDEPSSLQDFSTTSIQYYQAVETIIPGVFP